MRSFITSTLGQVHVITMVKSKRIGWTGHAVRMGRRRNAYRILMGKKNAVFLDVTSCEDGILHSHRRENLKSYILVGKSEGKRPQT
jgi:hypothetical protein